MKSPWRRIYGLIGTAALSLSLWGETAAAQSYDTGDSSGYRPRSAAGKAAAQSRSSYATATTSGELVARPSAYGFSNQRGPSTALRPVVTRGKLVKQDAKSTAPTTRSAPEEVRAEPVPEGEWIVDDGGSRDDGGFGDGDECSDCMDGHRGWLGCRTGLWEQLSILGGVHGFKGPVDQGQSGNFGFHQGLNYSIPLSYCCNIAAQVGGNVAQSNLSGSDFDNTLREQAFFTAGFFHRTQHGWQYGAVFDWLHDRYYIQTDLHQVRGELSWVSTCGNELGAMVAVSTNDDDAVEQTAAEEVTNFWKATDQLALFLRIPYDNGGEGRVYGGATSDREGILGADFLVPVTDHWSWQAAAAYRIPEASKGTGATAGHAHESWGLSINLVWTPGRSNRSECPNMFRPLFNVADNTSLIVDRTVR